MDVRSFQVLKDLADIATGRRAGVPQLLMWRFSVPAIARSGRVEWRMVLGGAGVTAESMSEI